MEKPYILLKEEMKKEVSEVISKHINRVMASDISDHLTKIVNELNAISQKQIEDAQKRYEESLSKESEEVVEESEVVNENTNTPSDTDL